MASDMKAIQREFQSAFSFDNASERIIGLLVPLLGSSGDMDPDDMGWIYWNICDCYALLRKPNEQYAVHAEFAEWAQTVLSPVRQHWVVSDSSQLRTLIMGGYSDFWWSVYQRANEQAPRIEENRSVRFEAHRAAASAYNANGVLNRSRDALDLLDALLAEDDQWNGHDFALATSLELQIEWAGAREDRDGLARLAERQKQVLGAWRTRIDSMGSRPLENPILGSWSQLNTTWDSQAMDSLNVATHNGACALVVAQSYPEAEQLFERYLETNPQGMSTYSTAMYLRSVWANRHDVDEVRSLLLRVERVTPNEIVRFAPDLAGVVS